jgi:hypothetical protein
MILDLLGNFIRAAGNKVTTSSLIKTWNSKIQAPHGGVLGIYCKEIYHTMTAAATNTLSATALPDGACLLGITGRVLTTSIAHNTRESIVVSTGVSGTTVCTIPLTSYCLVKDTVFSSTTTAAVVPIQVAADTDVTLTPASGSGNFVASGVIRFQIWYLLATAPTA